MTESLNDLSVFSSHLQDKLEILESEYQRWNDYKQDYDALEKQLTNLPDTTTQTAMIPIGKLAFMPGKIIHTNEIMVLLGDQYYAERSAKQAIGILQRRREVVIENLRLAEAQLNSLKHKTESLESNLFPSGDQLVNEDGLPIMEIREELPPKKEIEEETKPVAKTTTTPTNALPESVQRARDMMKNAKPVDTNDNNKALFDLLRELEEEEEELGEGEEEEHHRHPRITEIVEKDQKKNKNDDVDDDEDYSDFDDDDEEDDDDEDRYDMEVSSTMFDRFDDDDEYPYDQVVDQEDFSYHDTPQQPQQDEDEFDEDADRSVPKLITKKKKQNDSKPTKASPMEITVKEVITEPLPPSSTTEPVVEKKVSKFKAALHQNESQPEISPSSSSAPKKLSKFKLARQQEQQEQVKEEEKVVVFEEKKEKDDSILPPVKKVSKFKLARQQEQQQPQQQQEQQSNEKVIPEVKPIKDEVIAQAQSAKKVSKFKLARQQQQQDVVKESEPTKDIEKEEEEAVVVEREVAPPPVKKVSKFKLARQQEQEQEQQQQQQQQQQPQQEESTITNRHMIPEVAASKPEKRRFKPTIPKKGKTGRKVTWDTSTSVRDHDKRQAPSAVSETESYSEPVKNENSSDNNAITTIRSPADIFRVVKQTQQQHQQQQDEDGYPLLEEGNSNEPVEVDLNELVEAARVVPQSLYRPNDGNEVMIPMMMKQRMLEGDEDDEELEEDEKGIIIANKSKLDTNVMKGAVMERDTKPVNMEKVEDDMDLKEITSSYQRKRQSMLAATGGFSFEPKPEFEVFDEDLPLPKDEEEEEEEEEEVVVPKKMSRFKAARLGMKKDVEYQ